MTMKNGAIAPNGIGLPKEKPVRRQVCVHEAGHAVAYWWNGLHIKQCVARTREEVVKAGDGMSGRVWHSPCIVAPELALEFGLHDGNPRLEELVYRDLIGCFAGPVAESIYRRASLLSIMVGSGSLDLSDARCLLAFLPESQRAKVERVAVRRARVLIRQHWHLVSALADQLQLKGIIGGEEVTDLLCGVSAEAPVFLGKSLTVLDGRGGRYGR
ncbi:hypothetical protein [Pseudomonas sp. Q1-7]|uniref:hypothetical protein n=1 Tax=Pseudomonas sp. Q1-7 TaxID=3020843 RepID=UPI0023012BEE|nr:hypothetical protein [Pseudomonas sp. Q1-7]